MYSCHVILGKDSEFLNAYTETVAETDYKQQNSRDSPGEKCRLCNDGDSVTARAVAGDHDILESGGSLSDVSGLGDNVGAGLNSQTVEQGQDQKTQIQE